MKPALHSPRLAMVLASLLSACSLNPSGFWPTPLKPQKAEVTNATLLPEEAIRPKKTLTVDQTPAPPSASFVQPQKEWAQPSSKKEVADITLNFDQERLPTLIQLIYGTILKKNYSLDPAVANRTDLVTLRTGPQTPSQIEQTARLLLKSYGVAIIDLGSGVFRIVPDANLQGYSPEIRRGRALPKVPMPLRPIFQLVELQVVRTSDVTIWLKTMFPTKLTVQEDPARNAIMLSGQADDVAAGVEALRILDQPAMKGRHSARINPVFLSADEMAKRLGEVMRTEGYMAASTSVENLPITFIPIVAINAVIAFAADQSILSHALDWARELDQPSEHRGDAFFTYQVQNTDAQRLAETLREALSATTTPLPVPVASTVGGSASAVPPTQQPIASAKKIIVNAATNTLIFKGSNEEYTQLFGLFEKLDKPAKAAMIEVTVAEVDLTDNLDLGVELSSDMLKEGAFQFLTGGAGLTVNYIKGDKTLQALHALASQDRAKILSSPRLMARNGETATIQVGQQVPIVTGQLGSTATSATNPSVLTQVQYKDVGVILKVKPVIYSGNRIELEVAQEVSDAASTTTGVSTSPTINTKKVETRLALKDGSTIMLGGLISNQENNNVSGVPWLQDIPWLGQLFRENKNSSVRKELIILITPYTVLEDYDAQSITDAFRKQLGPWAEKNKIGVPVNRQ